MLNEAWVERHGNNPTVARKIGEQSAKEDAVNPKIWLIILLSNISKVHQGVAGQTI